MPDSALGEQYSKMRSKQINFFLALEPNLKGMMLMINKDTDGYTCAAFLSVAQPPRTLVLI